MIGGFCSFLASPSSSADLLSLSSIIRYIQNIGSPVLYLRETRRRTDLTMGIFRAYFGVFVMAVLGSNNHGIGRDAVFGHNLSTMAHLRSCILFRAIQSHDQRLGAVEKIEQ